MIIYFNIMILNIFVKKIKAFKTNKKNMTNELKQKNLIYVYIEVCY